MVFPYSLACKSSQQFVLPLILLDGVSSLCLWRCGLLLVLLLSSRKVQRSPLYRLLPCTGLPWTCPGCTGLPWISWYATEKRAGQPALVSISAVWPCREALKSPKWSPHPPLAQSMASDLKSEAEVWFPLRLASVFIVCKGWRGRGRGLCPVWSGGGG